MRDGTGTRSSVARSGTRSARGDGGPRVFHVKHAIRGVPGSRVGRRRVRSPARVAVDGVHRSWSARFVSRWGRVDRGRSDVPRETSAWSRRPPPSTVARRSSHSPSRVRADRRRSVAERRRAISQRGPRGWQLCGAVCAAWSTVGFGSVRFPRNSPGARANPGGFRGPVSRSARRVPSTQNPVSGRGDDRRCFT